MTYATDHGCHTAARTATCAGMLGSAADAEDGQRQPALLLRVDGEVDGVIAFRAEDAITGLCYVRNPAKLTRLATATPLTLR